MLEKLRKERGEEGFTLIELLVVIIIIGILAAIAIPVFLNQRQKGWEAAVQSDLRNAATAQETYLTENANYTTDIAALKSVGFKYSDSKNYSERYGVDHRGDSQRRQQLLHAGDCRGRARASLLKYSSPNGLKRHLPP